MNKDKEHTEKLRIFRRCLAQARKISVMSCLVMTRHHFSTNKSAKEPMSLLIRCFETEKGDKGLDILCRIVEYWVAKLAKRIHNSYDSKKAPEISTIEMNLWKVINKAKNLMIKEIFFELGGCIPYKEFTEKGMEGILSRFSQGNNKASLEKVMEIFMDQSSGASEILTMHIKDMDDSHIKRIECIDEISSLINLLSISLTEVTKEVYISEHLAYNVNRRWNYKFNTESELLIKYRPRDYDNKAFCSSVRVLTSGDRFDIDDGAKDRVEDSIDLAMESYLLALKEELSNEFLQTYDNSIIFIASMVGEIDTCKAETFEICKNLMDDAVAKNKLLK